MTGFNISENEIFTIIVSAISIIGGTGTWQKFKGKMQSFTNAFDSVDKAVDDVNSAVQSPLVTEAQFQLIWSDFIKTHTQFKALVKSQ